LSEGDGRVRTGFGSFSELNLAGAREVHHAFVE
jgi:hypothetical protein